MRTKGHRCGTKRMGREKKRKKVDGGTSETASEAPGIRDRNSGGPRGRRQMDKIHSRYAVLARFRNEQQVSSVQIHICK